MSPAFHSASPSITKFHVSTAVRAFADYYFFKQWRIKVVAIQKKLATISVNELFHERNVSGKK